MEGGLVDSCPHLWVEYEKEESLHRRSLIVVVHRFSCVICGEQALMVDTIPAPSKGLSP